MRKFPLKFAAFWPWMARLTPLCALFFVFLLPPPAFSSATAAVVSNHSRSQRVHSARRVSNGKRSSSRNHAGSRSHAEPRSHAGVARVAHRSRAARRSAALQARSSRTPSRRSTRTVAGLRRARRRRRLASTLDDVRMHTAAGAVSPSSFDGASSGTPEEMPAQQSSVAGVGHVAMLDTGASSAERSSPPQARNLPNFNVAVPGSMPMPLRGSHEVLVHQNIIADVEGLNRIQSEAQLSAMVRSGELVPLPAGSALVIDPRLPLNRRYCRPWTASFLQDLSRAHANVFGRPLQLTSAVRTVEFQRHLARYNGNAAPASGETASPHLTGQAIDLGKKGMSQHEIAWMREVLGQLQNSGKLDVEEEFEQACFHISVYRTYSPVSPAAASERLVAQSDAPSPAAIGSLARPQTTARALPAHSHSTARARRVSARRRRRRRHTGVSLLATRLR